MPALKILVIGGGIAGPTLAFWLAPLGHDVTILERTESLRAQGQQIDLRGQAVSVIRRMGLVDEVRAHVVDEEGIQFVDAKNRRQAMFRANKTGQGAQTFTSEFEIMRGSLVRILADAATARGAKFRFGTTVEGLEQKGNAVNVAFEDGTTETFDLVIGADGQSSRTRRMIMQPEEERYTHLNGFFCYFTIPREPVDTNYCTVFTSPNKSMCLRADNPETVQAYLGIYPRDDALRKTLRDSMATRDPDAQKRLYTELFKNEGWQASRIVKGMNETSNFYCQETAQVKSKIWSKGRVVLLGDAAHCASPVTGLGTTSAIVGAYVLAGEIATHCGGADKEGISDAHGALLAYNKTLRPFVDRVQQLFPGVPWIAFPSSWFWVWVSNSAWWALSWLQVDKLAQYFASDDVKGWTLPDYPIMQL
ncbi:hypothetical protein BN1723_012906, partial [Verticillium longisporum]